MFISSNQNVLMVLFEINDVKQPNASQTDS